MVNALPLSLCFIMMEKQAEIFIKKESVRR